MSSDHDITNTKEQQEQNEVNCNSGRSSPSLAQLVGGKSDGSPTTTSGRSNAAVKHNSNNDAILGEGNVSVDLKALLPTQKMKFMKLDVSLYIMNIKRFIVLLCFDISCGLYSSFL